MPDFKFWDPRLSLRYLKAKDYPETARQAIREVHRQVGTLQLDERGLARRGVLVRHLIMPGHLDETKRILYFLADEVSADTYVNLMTQYRPANKVNASEYAEIDRGITADEYRAAVDYARGIGLWRLGGRHPAVWVRGHSKPERQAGWPFSPNSAIGGRRT